jgi:hypothetical protein
MYHVSHINTLALSIRSIFIHGVIRVKRALPATHRRSRLRLCVEEGEDLAGTRT